MYRNVEKLESRFVRGHYNQHSDLLRKSGNCFIHLAGTFEIICSLIVNLRQAIADELFYFEMRT